MTRLMSHSRLAFALLVPSTGAPARNRATWVNAAGSRRRLHAAQRRCLRTRSWLVAALGPEADDQGSASERDGTGVNMNGGTTGRVADEQRETDLEQLDPVEAERLRKKREADALRAAERFMERDEGNYACSSCGYVYTPRTGEAFLGIPPGTLFEDIEEQAFRCPVCRAPKSAFQSTKTVVAGFAMNQKYGLGANTLTSGQKNALIFGGLFTAFLLLLSGYLLS
ncbi:hypothetical protein CCYA_CCYA14G3684 [Cyanidiococcus yangmingshanensis]|uniref:Rubredoxin-like domain-containing protein n=1 Tax=Cyanidiococcus yangmingshanensis TaxID=2690220 RepID=A0A7J7IGC4_9RHOD|nr:hypothetical protein F1559_003604 [Cyanidiococcus yangmingshanensis]KAK4532827.1 hypothetical protein CCYA_CCYA14G3684 [Cyanidiococcus yangmingshanensis]